MNINYTWICHKCESTNPPHTNVCHSCGFQAVASQTEVKPEANQKTKSTSQNWLYFPEGFIAVFLLAISPIWSIFLLAKAHYIAALLLVASCMGFAYSFYMAHKSKNNYIGYIYIVLFILVAFFISDATSA